MANRRKKKEAELQKSAAFAQLNPNPAMELTAEGAIPYFNDPALKLALAIGQNHPQIILPENIQETVQNCLFKQESNQHETQFQGRTLSWSFHPVSDNQAVHCYVEDITERLNLEAQFRQAQKMESVGPLAA